MNANNPDSSNNVKMRRGPFAMMITMEEAGAPGLSYWRLASIRMNI